MKLVIGYIDGSKTNITVRSEKAKAAINGLLDTPVGQRMHYPKLNYTMNYTNRVCQLHGNGSRWTSVHVREREI